MLRDLAFKHKMLLLPVAASAAFLGVFVVDQVLGARTSTVLRELQEDVVPGVAGHMALQAGRRL